MPWKLLGAATAAVVVGVLFAPLASADTIAPTTALDTYRGGTPNNSSYTGDVIGALGSYDTTAMTVSYDGTTLTVDVFSRYLDNVNSHQTYLGDLFISNDGWSPVLPAPFVDDTHLTGEHWEYVLHIDLNDAVDSAGETYSLPGSKGGAASLYELADAVVGNQNPDTRIQLSDDLTPSGYVFRTQQEILIDPGAGDTALGSNGSWQIHDMGTAADTDDFLRFQIDFAGLLPAGSPGLGLHWAMSCGNDAFEMGAASTPVPEPGSLLLFASGLFSWGVAAHRRKKALRA